MRRREEEKEVPRKERQSGRRKRPAEEKKEKRKRGRRQRRRRSRVGGRVVLPFRFILLLGVWSGFDAFGGRDGLNFLPSVCLLTYSLPAVYTESDGGEDREKKERKRALPSAGGVVVEEAS